MADAPDNLLGAYLRARREKLDPAALGLPATRRRTPACGARKSPSVRT